MVERRDLFDGYLLAGRLVESRACTTLAQATPTSDARLRVGELTRQRHKRPLPQHPEYRTGPRH